MAGPEASPSPDVRTGRGPVRPLRWLRTRQAGFALQLLFAGVVVFSVPTFAYVLSPADIRFPVVIAATLLACGFGRTYDLGLRARQAACSERDLVVLHSTRTIMWWVLTSGGLVAGLVFLAMDWVVAWFVISVPALTALGFAAGAFAFYSPPRAPLHVAEPQDALERETWRSVALWGCLSGTMLALLSAYMIDVPLVRVAVLIAGIVLGFASVSVWWSDQRPPPVVRPLSGR